MSEFEYMDIPEYPNYKIDRNGNVVNKKTLRILKPRTDCHGYKSLKLYNSEGPKNKKIHRLLGMCYIENPNDKPMIDHINRIRTDNRLENLRWVNASENCLNRGPYKNSKLKLKYITIGEYNKYKYYRLTMRPYNFIKSYNVNNYDLNDIIKIRDDIINAKSNGSVEEEQTIIQTST